MNVNELLDTIEDVLEETVPRSWKRPTHRPRLS